MNIAIILAGGTGTRMRSDGFPKQYVEVNGKPILIYTLEKFQACNDIDKIVVVAHCQWEEKIHEWVDRYQIHKFACLATQGETRQESVLNGLLACEQFLPTAKDVVVIHDAARPLVTPRLITTCISELGEHYGCLPVIPMKDSLCCSLDGRTISGLADRSTLFCGQSPESFRLLPYLELNRNASVEALQQTRGSFEIAYRNGLDIYMIPGEENNFKLTTSEDMNRLYSILENENGSK